MVRKNRGNVFWFFLLTGKATLPLKATSDVQIITRLGDVSCIASFWKLGKKKNTVLIQR